MKTQSKERAEIESLCMRLEEMPPLPFPLHGRMIQAPPSQGVYLILDSDEKVLHVGRTVRGQNGLLQRLRNHLSGKSTFVRIYLNGEVVRLRSGFKFKCIEVEDDRQRALLEHHATAWYCPAHLGLGR